MKPQPGFSAPVSAAGEPELPVILNGTFIGTDNWTDVDTGGTADATLTGTALDWVGGSNTAGNYVEQTISGISVGDVVTFQYELTASSEVNPPIFVLGGGDAFPGPSAAVGVQTVDVTAGATGGDLRIRGSGIGTTTWTMDNIEITAIVYA